tara:strand:- start:1294 stop:2202 length:909 start_codon:yes stop_codon:yes gene_type:complete
MINKNKYEEYTLLLGKGFALNVYLPALIETNCKKIVLDLSSKKYIGSNIHNKDIKWINENEIQENNFSKIIIAEPPQKQFKLIKDRSLWKNCNNFILEKPIAENHNKAKHLIEMLNERKIKYSVNYTFRYTKWLRKIYDYIHNNLDDGEIKVNWKFMGRHLQKKKSTWKTNHELGGGAIKYYGIHLIAILSDIGYKEVKSINIFNQPTNKINSWSCTFDSTNKLPLLKLNIDSSSVYNQFNWQQRNKSILNLETPFSLESIEYNYDKRIPPVIKFLQEENTKLLNLQNMNALQLWSKIESMI